MIIIKKYLSLTIVACLLLSFTLVGQNSESNKTKVEKQELDFSNIKNLELALERLSNYSLPKKPTKDDYLSFLNKLELELEARKKLFGIYVRQESSLLFSTPNKPTKSIVDVEFLENLQAGVLNGIYHEKVMNEPPTENFTRDYPLKSMYLKQLQEYIETQDIDQANNQLAKVQNIDSIHTALIEKISQHETLIEEKEKLMIVITQNLKDKTTFKRAENKTVKDGSSSQNLAQNFNQVTVNVENIIKNLNQLNTIYKPNFEEDNKLMEDRKGFMNWPLPEGELVVRHNEKIKESNGKFKSQKGIILSSNSPKVQSICQGVVAHVGQSQNNSKFLILKHDNNYYSVYSNLKDTYVAINQHVKFGEGIGEASINNSKKYAIQFQIWNLDDNLNPLRWLKNK